MHSYQTVYDESDTSIDTLIANADTLLIRRESDSSILRVSDDVVNVDEAFNVAYRLARNVDVDKVAVALSHLQSSERNVVVAALYGNVRYPELAHNLGISERVVKLLIRSGLSKLRYELQEPQVTYA